MSGRKFPLVKPEDLPKLIQDASRYRAHREVAWEAFLVGGDRKKKESVREAWELSYDMAWDQRYNRETGNDKQG